MLLIFVHLQYLLTYKKKVASNLSYSFPKQHLTNNHQEKKKKLEKKLEKFETKINIGKRALNYVHWKNQTLFFFSLMYLILYSYFVGYLKAIKKKKK